MTTSKESKASNGILGKVCSQRALFDFFDHVYLFGSSLKNSYPNDIDILITYSKYENTIGTRIREISEKLMQVCNLPIHITALSIQEAEETEFLKRIVSYQMVK